MLANGYQDLGDYSPYAKLSYPAILQSWLVNSKYRLNYRVNKLIRH